jgi:uncharacterized protein (UPF0332 family)
LRKTVEDTYGENLHRFLHTGFTNRNIGDYDYRVECPRDEAERTLARADRFLRDVHAYLAKEGWLSA